MGAACRNRCVTFASSFACFLTRAYDQIRMGAISQSNSNFCGSHCGVSIGEFWGKKGNTTKYRFNKVVYISWIKCTLELCFKTAVVSGITNHYISFFLPLLTTPYLFYPPITTLTHHTHPPQHTPPITPTTTRRGRTFSDGFGGHCHVPYHSYLLHLLPLWCGVGGESCWNNLQYQGLVFDIESFLISVNNINNNNINSNNKYLTM